MPPVGAASITCEQKRTPHYWEDAGKSSPLKLSTRVRLSVQFVRGGEPTCSLAVFACVIPPLLMQHAVLLGRNNWMHFNSLFYHSLPPPPPNQRIFGELELVHHAPTGISVYAFNPAASGRGSHLRY